MREVARSGAGYGCLLLPAICIPDIFAQHVLREMEYRELVSHSVYTGEAPHFHKKAPGEIAWRPLLPSNNVERPQAAIGEMKSRKHQHQRRCIK